MNASPRFTPGTARNNALTILEILLVICILAVLAILLFPVMGRTLGKTKEVRLAGNLRSLASAMHQFASENDGIFPFSFGTEKGFWQQALMPYTQVASYPVTSSSLFHDPLDTARYPINGQEQYAPNIAINGMTAYTSGTPKPATAQGVANRRIASIAQPSKLLMLTTGQKQPDLPGENADAFYGYVGRLTSNAFATPEARAQLTRVPGLYYCAFADGHVERVDDSFIAGEVSKSASRTSSFFDGGANNAGGW